MRTNVAVIVARNARRRRRARHTHRRVAIPRPLINQHGRRPRQRPPPARRRTRRKHEPSTTIKRKADRAREPTTPTSSKNVAVPALQCAPRPDDALQQPGALVGRRRKLGGHRSRRPLATLRQHGKTTTTLSLAERSRDQTGTKAAGLPVLGSAKFSVCRQSAHARPGTRTQPAGLKVRCSTR